MKKKFISLLLIGALSGCESTSNSPYADCQPLTYECHVNLKKQYVGNSISNELVRSIYLNQSGEVNKSFELLKSLEAGTSYEKAVVDKMIAMSLIGEFDYANALTYIENAINDEQLNADEYKTSLLIELESLLQLGKFDVFKSKALSFLSYIEKPSLDFFAMIKVYSERGGMGFEHLNNNDAVTLAEIDTLANIYRSPQTFNKTEIAPVRKVIIEPKYPAKAYRKDIDGWVNVRYDIDKNGQPININVLDSNPKGIFEETAIQTVSTWRYHVSLDENYHVKGGKGLKVLIDWSSQREDQVIITTPQ